MPITNEVLRDGRVVLSTYVNFTVVEISQMMEFMQREILAHATKKVYTIADFTHAGRLPHNILTIALKTIKKTDPMNELVLIVTPNEFIQRLGDIFVRLTPSDMVYCCRSVKEALAEVDRRLAIEAKTSPSSEQINHPV